MKGIAGLLVLLAGVLVLFESVQARSKFCQDCCALQFKVHGCFKDQRTPRNLPDLVLYERYKVNWANWEVYMFDFICRCAYAARNASYRYFGVQFWGECWAGNDWDQPESDRIDKCYTCEHQPCVWKTDKYCVGKQWSNYVYELVEPCDLKLKYIGCYKDRKNRALKDYALTGRQNLVGRLAKVGRLKDKNNWFNYDTWLPQFACECAHKAKTNGMEYFGLQFWGECWIAKTSSDNYARYGIDKTKCNDNCFEKCNPGYCVKRWCVGVKWANAVYQIITT